MKKNSISTKKVPASLPKEKSRIRVFGIFAGLLFLLIFLLPVVSGFDSGATQVNAQVVTDTYTYLPFIINPEQPPTPPPPPPPPPNNCGNRGGDWPMVAGNLERTSWTDEEVCGNLNLEWYKPIEAYIPQNSQVIAAYGYLYISTARGLYTLDAATGDTVWRFDTEMPLGNSPTVADGVVYVGGYDKRLHALDAASGTHLWDYSGAKAGYELEPPGCKRQSDYWKQRRWSICYWGA